MSEPLARRLSRLGSSGYIKVGGTQDAGGPWREPPPPDPEDHQDSIQHKAVATAGASRGEL